MFKSQIQMSESDKTLVRELFGKDFGQNELSFIPEELEAREESNRLYFELRNEYDSKL